MVFKRRTRLVSIRVAEDEYAKLLDASVSLGARSVSDFVRHSLFQKAFEPSRPASSLEQRFTKLKGEVRSLSNSLDELRHDLKTADQEAKET